MSAYILLYEFYPHDLQIGISVRCLIWSDNATILIGDLGGNIYKWNIASSCGLWTTLEGSVIHIRQSYSKKVSINVYVPINMPGFNFKIAH